MSATGPSHVQPLRAGLRARLFTRRNAQKYKREDIITGYLFIAVPIIIFIAWVFGAMAFDFWISFHHWDILTPPRSVGSANYNYVFNDSLFRTAIKNTVQFSIIVVTGQTIIAFFLALIVNQNIRGKKFFRTAFYFPSVTSSVAISLLFLWLFNDLGLVNYLLTQIGLPRVGWLSNPHIALKSIMGLNIWTTTGTYMIIFLAALQDVPRDLLEAAAIDGASALQTVRKITIPMIRPAIFFVVATSLIGTLQVFDQAYVLSQGNGGPEDSTMTAVLYIYTNAFKYGFYGVAAAASFALFAFIFIVTILVRTFFEREA